MNRQDKKRLDRIDAEMESMEQRLVNVPIEQYPTGMSKASWEPFCEHSETNPYVGKFTHSSHLTGLMRKVNALQAQTDPPCDVVPLIPTRFMSVLLGDKWDPEDEDAWEALSISARIGDENLYIILRKRHGYAQWYPDPENPSDPIPGEYFIVKMHRDTYKVESTLDIEIPNVLHLPEVDVAETKEYRHWAARFENAGLATDGRILLYRNVALDSSGNIYVIRYIWEDNGSNKYGHYKLRKYDAEGEFVKEVDIIPDSVMLSWGSYKGFFFQDLYIDEEDNIYVAYNKHSVDGEYLISQGYGYKKLNTDLEEGTAFYQALNPRPADAEWRSGVPAVRICALGSMVWVALSSVYTSKWTPEPTDPPHEGPYVECQIRQLGSSKWIKDIVWNPLWDDDIDLDDKHLMNIVLDIAVAPHPEGSSTHPRLYLLGFRNEFPHWSDPYDGINVLKFNPEDWDGDYAIYERQTLRLWKEPFEHAERHIAISDSTGYYRFHMHTATIISNRYGVFSGVGYKMLADEDFVVIGKFGQTAFMCLPGAVASFDMNNYVYGPYPSQNYSPPSQGWILGVRECLGHPDGGETIPLDNALSDAGAALMVADLATIQCCIQALVLSYKLGPPLYEGHGSFGCTKAFAYDGGETCTLWLWPKIWPGDDDEPDLHLDIDETIFDYVGVDSTACLRWFAQSQYGEQYSWDVTPVVTLYGRFTFGAAEDPDYYVEWGTVYDAQIGELAMCIDVLTDDSELVDTLDYLE